MEKTSSQNIQDAFLNTLRREKAIITIHLLHGSTLNGRLKSFDKFSVLIDSNGQEFLIFKHAIATVTHQQSRRPIDSEHSSGGHQQFRRNTGEQQMPPPRNNEPPRS